MLAHPGAFGDGEDGDGLWFSVMAALQGVRMALYRTNPLSRAAVDPWAGAQPGAERCPVELCRWADGSIPSQHVAHG